jgi:dihydroorotate dehydrogenase (NAD+) catalytic subunit
MVPKPITAVDVCGIKMKNPVMAASGTFGYGIEFAGFVDLNRLGAIVVKGLTLRPRPGNPPPRAAETPSGMLNSIGLQNIGPHEFIKEKLPALKNYNVPIIANIACSTVDEFGEVAAILNNAGGLAGIEINVSCPNVREGGMIFGSSPDMTFQVVRRVRNETRLPVITKLSPNVTDITTIAKAAVEAGSDALSLINTVLGMAVDVKTRKPLLGSTTGGLSGPAIKPIALRCLWQVARAVKVPLIGMGGITAAEDALEFIIVGATAVAVGTANLIDPKALVKIIAGIEKYLYKNKIGNIKDLVGSLITDEVCGKA